MDWLLDLGYLISFESKIFSVFFAVNRSIFIFREHVEESIFDYVLCRVVRRPARFHVDR